MCLLRFAKGYLAIDLAESSSLVAKIDEKTNETTACSWFLSIIASCLWMKVYCTMDVFKEEKFLSAHLGHLGLVADKIDSLNLIDLIDHR